MTHPDFEWTTAAGKKMMLSQMNLKHINNTLKMLHGKGKQDFPDFWQGRTKQEWIVIFNDEKDWRITRFIFGDKKK